MIAADPPETLRVMSFNIRYGSAKDGDNSWPRRRDFVIETIQNFHPDILGTQETEKSQKDDLAAQLTDYTCLAAGRNDGADQGEMMAVFYKTARFTRLDGGHFWLSETPDVPGSKSWDSSLPRMVTWLKLQDNSQPARPILWYFNTHFDHLGKTARAESSKLLHRRIAELPDNSNVVVTGDFNSGEGSLPYENLFAPQAGQTLLQDAYRLAHPERTKNETTFNNFNPLKREGARIDWLAVTRPLQVDSIEINHVSRDGRVPSDHFPLEAVLKYTAPESLPQ